MTKSTFLPKKHLSRKTYQDLGSIPCSPQSDKKEESTPCRGEPLTIKVFIRISFQSSVDTVHLIKKQSIPGPGSYEPKVGLDKYGIYHLSNL